MEEVDLTVKGLPRRTGEQVIVDFSDIREVVTWNNRIMGIAESTFRAALPLGDLPCAREPDWQQRAAALVYEWTLYFSAFFIFPYQV